MTRQHRRFRLLVITVIAIVATNVAISYGFNSASPRDLNTTLDRSGMPIVPNPPKPRGALPIVPEVPKP